MIVDQPWPIISRAISGLDAQWVDPGGPPVFTGPAKAADVDMEEDEEGEVQESIQGGRKGEGARGTRTVTESTITTLAWSVLNQLSVSRYRYSNPTHALRYLFPISILYHPNVIAFACFQFTVKLLLPDDRDFPSCLDSLAPRFGLSMPLEIEEDGPGQSDMELVEGVFIMSPLRVCDIDNAECMKQIAEFASVDLKTKNKPILRGFWAWMAVGHVSYVACGDAEFG
jgi:hypothetical protein